MTREEQIMNDPNLSAYTDKQRGWINEAFMDGVRWADDNRPVDWQQIRIQASIAAMKGLISNPDDFTTNQSPSGIAKKSILFADTLVKELRGE